MNIDDVKEDLKKKNYKKALISIEKILIKNPNLEQNVNLKGVILANLDRVIEARQCWLNAIKINSSYFESSASITEDESYIYFVSERPSGLGKTDIYYVKKTNKIYSEPIHLGNEINTKGDEKCVFIHPTGTVSYTHLRAHET